MSKRKSTPPDPQPDCSSMSAFPVIARAKLSLEQRYGSRVGDVAISSGSRYHTELAGRRGGITRISRKRVDPNQYPMSPLQLTDRSWAECSIVHVRTSSQRGSLMQPNRGALTLKIAGGMPPPWPI